MLMLGLILIGLAAAAILGAFFVTDGGQVSYFGIEMPPLAIFLVGAATVGVIWLGFVLTTYGTKRGLRTRKERKEINHLSERLDKAEERKRGTDLDGDGKIG